MVNTLLYTTYDPDVPVARKDANVLIGYPGPSGVVTPGEDKVMCLSCHRAYASPHKDVLRWDYDTMEKGTTGSAAGTGCFKCHSEKDGS